MNTPVSNCGNANLTQKAGAEPSGVGHMVSFIYLPNTLDPEIYGVKSRLLDKYP
jgi:hypothetical protein